MTAHFLSGEQAEVHRGRLWHRTSKIGRVFGKKRAAASAADCDVPVDMKLVNQLVSIWADESDCSLCPLNRVKAGVAVRIKQLCASPEVASRLREIGFGEEQIIHGLGKWAK